MSIAWKDYRAVWSNADSTTGWTGATTQVTAPEPIEGTACNAIQVSLTTADIYFTSGSAQNFSSRLIYVWTTNRAALNSIVNVGAGILLGDGTNRVAFGVGGSDATPFRHEDGPVNWACGLIDTANLPSYQLGRAGTSASLNTAACTQVGMTFVTLAKSVGGAVNCFVDIIRIGDPSLNRGAMAVITGGTSGDPGTFLQMANADRSTGSSQAYGLIRKVEVGAYGIQGKIMFGNPTGSASSWFADTNSTIVFENRGLLNTRQGIVIAAETSGTSTFQLGTKVGTGTSAVGGDGCSLTCPAGVGGIFDAQSSPRARSVYIYGSTFSGFTNGIQLNSGSEFIGNVVSNCGAIEPSGAAMFNNNINTTTATSSVYYNADIDPLLTLTGCTFVASSSYRGHGIEFGPKTPTSFSLDTVTFSSFGNTTSTSASLYNNSGKDLYITMANAPAPTYRNAGGLTTTIVTGLTQVTLTGLVSGTEVSVLTTGTTDELAHTEGTATTPSTFAFNLAATTIVDIVIHNIFYDYIRLNEFTIPSTDTSIPITQIFDRNYSNP